MQRNVMRISNDGEARLSPGSLAIPSQIMTVILVVEKLTLRPSRHMAYRITEKGSW